MSFLRSFTALSELAPARKMYYPPINKAMLSTNIHATVIVGMWVVHPEGCWTESTNIFQSQSETPIPF